MKAAGFRAAKARAVGTGGSSGGTTAREAEVARLTAAAATPPLQSAGGRSGQADPALGGWDGGRLPGEQSWDENVPDGKLLGERASSIESGTLLRHPADSAILAG